jgi:hypothetical protein
VVRHGHAPERLVQTGIGPVPVRRAKLRDRGAGDGAERIRFTSAILPRWARRTRSLDALLPILYLREVSMGDFGEALGALLGRTRRTSRPRGRAVAGRMEADHAHWQRRDLSRGAMCMSGRTASTCRRDGAAGECIVVLIGAREASRKPGLPVLRECAQTRASCCRPQGARNIQSEEKWHGPSAFET